MAFSAASFYLKITFPVMTQFIHLQTILTAVSVAALSVTMSPAAQAFTFGAGDRVGISTEDIGTSFMLDFGGNVEGQDVLGLSSRVVFTFWGFEEVVSGSSTITEARFAIQLDNTSFDGLTSRTSALAFDVFDAAGNTLALLGLGSKDGDGKTRSSGLFEQDGTGALPNGFGSVDVCFYNQNQVQANQQPKSGGTKSSNDCAGGGSGGVATEDDPGIFYAVLAFQGTISEFWLGNFGVRYQSITGTNSEGQTFQDDSGTGVVVAPGGSDYWADIPEAAYW